MNKREAVQLLQDFLPEKIFDAHMHIHPAQRTAAACGFDSYLEHYRPIFGADRMIRANMIPFPLTGMDREETKVLDETLSFTKAQMKADTENVCEVMVFPNDAEADIEKRIFSPQVRGLKCYHTYAQHKSTWCCGIEEYLPESAWNVAKKHSLCITLHMVRDRALADEGNLRYIREMARRYPDVVLILAHAARGFASWTTVDTVHLLKDLDNVWFDFSAVCESPAIFQILKDAGVSRSMWGSDYPISKGLGKAISLGGGFCWLDESSVETQDALWPIGLENLMAVRQACRMAEVDQKGVDAIFYRNAANLFVR